MLVSYLKLLKDFIESIDIDRCFWSFCGENPLKQNLSLSIKISGLFLYSIYFNTLVMCCKAVFKYFSLPSGKLPLGAYAKRQSAVLAKMVAPAVAHIL